MPACVRECTAVRPTSSVKHAVCKARACCKLQVAFDSVGHVVKKLAFITFHKPERNLLLISELFLASLSLKIALRCHSVASLCVPLFNCATCLPSKGLPEMCAGKETVYQFEAIADRLEAIAIRYMFYFIVFSRRFQNHHQSSCSEPHLHELVHSPKSCQTMSGETLGPRAAGHARLWRSHHPNPDLV